MILKAETIIQCGGKYFSYSNTEEFELTDDISEAATFNNELEAMYMINRMKAGLSKHSGHVSLKRVVSLK